MGRCGCSSLAATGAAAQGSNCINVSGAGTPLSPFLVAMKLNPASDNLAECGSSGLYVPAPEMAAADTSLEITEGTGEGDYDFSVRLASAADLGSVNWLELAGGIDGGLGVPFAGINLGFLTNVNPLAGSLPELAPSCRFFVQIDTPVVAVDGIGNTSVVFPVPFPNALMAFIPVNGDLGTGISYTIALGGYSVSGVNMHLEGVTAGTAGTNQRIHYIAIGC